MKVLSVERDLRPWKGVIRLSDAQGEELYTASSGGGFPKATWTLSRGREPLATLRCEALSFLPTCHVAMGEDKFVFRNRAAMRRRIAVEGGPFDGAELSGTLLDGDFRLEHKGRLLAQADAMLFSMRDKHSVRLMAEEPAAEAFTALMMVNLMIQKEAEWS
jgi:uncharacterized protein YxjI